MMEMIDKMDTAQKCRWFAENLTKTVDAESEEAKVFKEAADEIEHLVRVNQNLIDYASGRKTLREINVPA